MPGHHQYSRRISNFIVFMVMMGCLAVQSHASGKTPRKIVVFSGDFSGEAKQKVLIARSGGQPIKHLRLINATAAHLPRQAEETLARRPEVLRIDDDLVVQAVARPSGAQPAEEIPWGVGRIKADQAWPFTTGLAIKVAIVDTGIDLDHADLKYNIKGQVNTINPLKMADDDNGHGTHVAGTVAAVNNSIGVVGVGPKISLYAVKVLGKSGSGWLSDIIEGLDWCVSNGIQVVNMSLGSSTDNLSFHEAVIRVYEAGIIQVVAAGNNGSTTGEVSYPARYPEVIAVSAAQKLSDGSLVMAPFSSSGPEVDLIAPGASIKSTYKDGYYKTLNGTSMAAPHVAGVAALTLAVKGPKTPEEMQSHLKNTAENIRLSSQQQGAGLVRADQAVQ